VEVGLDGFEAVCGAEDAFEGRDEGFEVV